MTRVMFTGPHGIGKSQTCMKLNKARPHYLYIPSFAGPVAKRMGFDLNKPHTPDQLIEYQERVLEVFLESYKMTASVDTIYDRSPIDLAAYMAMGLPHWRYSERVADFAKRCILATREYCDILIYPEADLTEQMEDKYNRPKAYDREAFDHRIDYYVSQLHSNKVKVIDVPKEYQYDERVNYILKRI